jgi:mannose-6-phosphate isomerase-like protein (cupin superfamily)
MTVTTGRTIDETGAPVPGTGFEFEPGSWLAERITEREGPVTSHPTRPVWGIPMPAEGDCTRTLTIVGADYGGPAEHYHEQSREVFDVREGELTLTRDGTDERIGAGSRATVETGVRHTFRNDSDVRAVLFTEIQTPGRLDAVLPTLGGLAHDPERDPGNLLQRVLIAQRLSGNTVFTDQERPGVGRVTDALAPVARLAGYRGGYGKYLQPAFWWRHVEQPATGRTRTR